MFFRGGFGGFGYSPYGRADDSSDDDEEALRWKIPELQRGSSEESQGKKKPSKLMEMLSKDEGEVDDGEEPEKTVNESSGSAPMSSESMKQPLTQSSGTVTTVSEYYCVECTDQPCAVKCMQCEDLFCDVCFFALHRRGKRKSHKTQAVKPKAGPGDLDVGSSGGSSGDGESKTPSAMDQGSDKQTSPSEEKSDTPKAPKSKGNDVGPVGKPTINMPDPKEFEVDFKDLGITDEVKEKLHKVKFKIGGSRESVWTNLETLGGIKEATQLEKELKAADFMDIARFIPLRLSLDERKLLRLVESCMFVSEYTDHIDIYSHKSKTKRIRAQIKEICSILTGLVVAADFKVGKELVEKGDFVKNEAFFQRCFELARRHKVRNPEKMRESYGKLLYMLMDSQDSRVQQMLGFKCVRPLQTVYTYLREKKGLALLKNPYLHFATRNRPHWRSLTRDENEREKREMDIIRKKLARYYSENSDMDYDECWNVLMSICDYTTYLSFNRDPVDKMLSLLKKHFHPTETKSQRHSLAIRAGQGTARLSHNHATQYQYVYQTLMLWRDILNDFYKLWVLAENDLLVDDGYYALRDTGQGLNRVQSCPQVGRAMREVLYRCQRNVGQWVGSSVVHLGDHNVPNALNFVDKYSQVPRILNPIVIALERLPKLYKEKKDIRDYVDREFGSLENMELAVLSDFFRFGFDGSGADNFFDAGSCIDGRLTSAWNWCSLIEKKPFYHLFLLTEFVGFDGTEGWK